MTRGQGMPNEVVCTRCGARFRPPDPDAGAADALQALDAWLAEHKRICPRGPAAFKLTSRSC